MHMKWMRLVASAYGMPADAARRWDSPACLTQTCASVEPVGPAASVLKWTQHALLAADSQSKRVSKRSQIVGACGISRPPAAV